MLDYKHNKNQIPIKKIPAAYDGRYGKDTFLTNLEKGLTGKCRINYVE